MCIACISISVPPLTSKEKQFFSYGLKISGHCTSLIVSGDEFQSTRKFFNRSHHYHAPTICFYEKLSEDAKLRLEGWLFFTSILIPWQSKINTNKKYVLARLIFC